MSIEEFSSLEARVTGMVNEMKRLRRENLDLKTKLEKIRTEKNLDRKEKEDIRSKVQALIQLVDTLEKNDPED